MECIIRNVSLKASPNLTTSYCKTVPQQPMEERPYPELHFESLCTPDDKMTYIVKSYQRQSNGYDCGVFAIAFATSLANREDPITRLYNQKKLCALLVDCMASGTLTPFPSDSIRAKRSKEIVQEEKVFCTCRRTGWERTGLQLIGCDAEGYE